MSAKRARGRFRALVDGSPILSFLNYAKGQVGYRLGLHRHRSGATRARLTLDQSVEYVHRCGGDYLRYAAVEEGFLEGRRILELGPGDNLGMALFFLAKGAATVVCVEAFDPPHDPRRNVQLYRALYDSFTDLERARAQRALRILGERSIELAPERLRYYRRTRIEDAPARLAGETFDLAVSRAVLEHVASVERAWTAMVTLLDPRGAMWHKVDFRHHGYFGQRHPLHFLTVGERAWSWMSSPDPTLNRKRIDTYRALADGSFRQSKILVTHVLEGEEILPHVESLAPGIHYGDRELELIRQIRPRLEPRFRELTDEDLLVGGIFAVAHDLRRSSPICDNRDQR